MISAAASYIMASYFARRKDWVKVESICEAALAKRPSPFLGSLLLLRSSNAARVRKGHMRSIELLEAALDEARQLPLLRNGLETLVSKNFQRLCRRGRRTSYEIVLGNVLMNVVAGRRGKLHLVGLFTENRTLISGDSVGVLIGGVKVGDALVRRLDIRKTGISCAYFQFNLSRSVLAGLGEEGIVEVEVDGQKCQLPRSFFGKFWPRNADDSSTLLKVKQGYVLEKGGQLIVPKNRNDEWMLPTFALYTKARNWFKDHYDYDLYLTGGTLLGFARGRELIAFDKDFDSGYISRHRTLDAIRGEFLQIIVDLLKAGEDIRLESASRAVRRDYFMWHGPDGEHIDVFPASLVNDRYRRPTFVDTALTAGDLLPMSVQRLHGVDVVVPKNFEKKVAAVYGPNWRHPDPLWKKIRTPAIIEYRENIMLSEMDLLEVAQHSEKEGAWLRDLIATGQMKTQY